MRRELQKAFTNNGGKTDWFRAITGKDARLRCGAQFSWSEEAEAGWKTWPPLRPPRPGGPCLVGALAEPRGAGGAPDSSVGRWLWTCCLWSPDRDGHQLGAQGGVCPQRRGCVTHTAAVYEQQSHMHSFMCRRVTAVWRRTIS